MQRKTTKPLFDTLTSLYLAIADETDNKVTALLLVQLRSWLTNICEFDPRSGHELPQGLDEFLQKLATGESQNKNAIQDRFYRILEHVNDALQATLDNLNNKILREHAMVPIYAAREVDRVSIQWLSKQTGRNLREKLAGKPYIKAVRRRSSSDTTENKLLKAFVIKLEDKLYNQETLFKALNIEYNDRLLLSLQRWLRQEEAIEIGLWNNIPPNNTLLQDRCYRKIWDSWLWLQRLDDDVQRDTNRLSSDLLTAIYWPMISVLKQSNQVRLIQQPVMFDYDHYQLSSFENTIEGYLYPEQDSSIYHGMIRNIVADKSFGFIQTKEKKDYFFHANDLISESNFENLKVKTVVSFIVGTNNQGECAKKIRLYNEIKPKQLTSRLSDDEIQITVESEEPFTLKKVDVELAFQLNPTNLSHFILQTSHTFLNTLKIKKREIDIAKVIKSEVKSAVIDLCLTRPTFTTERDPTNAQHLSSRLLLQRWKSESPNTIDIDCSSSAAIRLAPNILSTSMYDLFSDDMSEDKKIKEFRADAAMFFANKIHQHIQTNRLTYLVPDAINDFSLVTIRKNINFNYPDATPLPRSIAAIFEWQLSNILKTSKIKENDIIVAIDITNNGYSLTPIICKYRKELKSRVFESKGFYWERHPSVVIDKKDITHRLLDSIKTISNPNEILALLGLEGVINEAGQLSFSDNKSNWFDIPDELTNFQSNNKDESTNIVNEIRENLPVVKSLSINSTLFILPLSRGISPPKSNNKDVVWLSNSTSITTGGFSLNQWQKQAGDIPLWRDHLPELSIKIIQEGRTKLVFLVKDKTVAPMRDKQISIDIEEPFTLPANKSSYSFPLNIGNGKQALHYLAELGSPHFPLAVDTDCKLKMTYTYGADNPYQLKFVPEAPEKAGFNSVLVNWRSIGSLPSIDLSILPVPDFPKPETWDCFQSYPGKRKATNLLDVVNQTLIKLKSIRKYGRKSGEIPKWITKDNDNVFCFIDNTFIHKSKLNISSNDDLPQPGKILSFYKIENERGKFSGESVCIGEKEPKECFLAKIRFHVLTIWNNGHSLSESDVPSHFRDTIQEASKSAINLINSEEVLTSLKDELFFFLSCLHKDAPIEVAESLIEYSKDKQNLRNYHRHIAFAIGSGELDWQKELLANTLNPVDNEDLTRSITLEILSIAFWRVESLVFKLDADTIDTILDNLLTCIKIDITTTQKVSTLCKHLELLLALLRTRKHDPGKIKAFLSPNRDITKKLIQIIDDIIDKGFKLESRISLNIHKPESLNKTPDLLYALKMYLSGDDGANTIVVKRVNVCNPPEK